MNQSHYASLNKEALLETVSKILDALNSKTANNSVPDALKLNGGIPMLFGVNLNISFKKFQKGSLKAIFDMTDKNIWPSDPGSLNKQEFVDLLEKVEPSLFIWLEDKENLLLFTAYPVKTFEKFCMDNGFQIPGSVQPYFNELKKLNANGGFSVPGVKFKTVRSSINNTGLKK